MVLVDGAVSQLRVVNALVLRESQTRYGAHRLGYLWALLEPAFWILTFYAMFALTGRPAPSGMELFPFLTAGILTYQLFAATSDRCAQAINANKALLFYPQVQPLDLIIARSSLELATFVTVFLALVGAHAMIVQELSIDSALTAIAGTMLAGLLGATIGLVFCALGVLSNAVDRIKGPLMRPLFWISGLFFTANELPTFIRDVLLYNPVLHCVEIVRDGWFPTYHAHHADPGYVLWWIVGLAFLGLTLERQVRGRVELS